jgi:hypothetical protein
MFSGKIVGILGLIAQAAAVCFWTWEAAYGAWLAFTDPEHKQLVGASVLLIAMLLALAAGTAYCIYRQFKWAAENRRFTAWLVTNAEKIATTTVFLSSQRITPTANWSGITLSSLPSSSPAARKRSGSSKTRNLASATPSPPVCTLFSMAGGDSPSASSGRPWPW